MKLRLLLFLFLAPAWLGAVVLASEEPARKPPIPSATDLQAWDQVEKARAAAKKDPKLKISQISEQDIEGWLRTQDFIAHGKGDFTPLRWRNNHLDQPNIRTFPVVEVERFANDPLPTPEKAKWELSFHLRQSYSDVLAIEDPTQATDPNKRYEDLKGGMVSYTRDRKAGTDTWSAQAALLLPIIRTTGRGDSPEDWTTLSYGLIPSISVYRIDTNKATTGGKPPPNEVDQLTYRAEIYGKYSSPWKPLETLTLRGFGAYITNTGHDLAIPAAQLELEPQLFFSPKLAIGYHQTVIRGPFRDQIPGLSDYFAEDNSLLGYQLRLRLHGDFGKIVNSGNTGLPPDSFLRGGPIAELKLWPVITDRLSFTFAYSYLPAAFGPDDHNSLFSAAVELVVLKRPEAHQILSLKATYSKGGIDVTQVQVDTFQFGLAATF